MFLSDEKHIKHKLSNGYYLELNKGGDFYYWLPNVIDIRLSLDIISKMTEPIKSEILTIIEQYYKGLVNENKNK